MARKDIQELAYTAIRIEGGLIPAEELARLTTLNTPDQTEQTERHYGIPKGLKLRDEIARNFKIAQNLWQDFQLLRQRKDVDAYGVTVREFLTPMLRHSLGYVDLVAVAGIQTTNSTHNSYPIGHAALNGRLPVVMTGHDQPLDQASERFGDKNPDTGRTRRRSPYMLAQEALNASDASLWALVSNGLNLRILRDNPSLTRPAYIEVDLEAIFTEELYADFTAFWMLAHASRFGEPGAEPADCAWERWREAGQQAGVTVRQNLRYQVADALRSLGTGFLRHPSNTNLRTRLHDPEVGSATKQVFFEELLSLVYRFIFLATVEDRTDSSSGRSLIFAPNVTEEVQQRYWTGYSLTWLRERAARRSSHDIHSDLWQALSITFDGLATGQLALGLPALGGLFAAEQCPLLNGAQIDNRHLLAAVFQLGYFRQPAGLTRVNYRDMGAEELGSVYESLLELVPDIQNMSQPHAAKLSFVGDDDKVSNRGNARKLTGSYYTPDSLVQELIKSSLEPIIEQTVKDASDRPVEALLQLTVCDPACGSGHFLLAAARRLADEVAKLRAAQSGGAPTPAVYRHALRDVVSHCIYGVDKNPMAVALAKTALWLEAYTPDRPLTFLDAHLRCGDALLGVLDPAVLKGGIPEKAFNSLSGDDKEVVKRIKKANRDALKAIIRADASGGQLTLGLEPQADASAFETLPDNTLEALHAKREAFTAVQARIAASHSRLAADLFVAAFVLPKTPDTEAATPTSQDLWLVQNGSTPRSSVAEAAHRAAEAAQAFHWWQAFPQVYAKGGFNVLLGNPPWERIKLQEEEFFASRSPLIANAKNKAERAQRIELLRQGMLLHTVCPDVEAAEGLQPPNRAEKSLHEHFITVRRWAEAASLLAHDSGRFPLTGVGDVNTYALFAETMLQLTAPTGRAGFIVPTGIATDDSTKRYFEAITQKKRLVALYSFENEEFVFPAVHHAMKFCLVITGGHESSIQEAEFVHFARQVHHLYDAARRFSLTPEEFGLINPNTRTCPVFRSQRDAELTKKLHRVAPVLVRDGNQGANPWGFDYMTKMFDMAESSHEFIEAKDVGRVQVGQGEIKAESPEGLVSVPLYEAKNLHLFDHRWSTFNIGQATADDVDVHQKQDSGFEITTRYWVKAARLNERLGSKEWSKNWLMGWRDVTNATNERTLICGFFPRCAAAHTLRVMFLSRGAEDALLFVACLSSLVLDYVARQKVGGTHLTVETLKQLPVLEPDTFSALDRAFIVPRVLELVYVTESMEGLAKDLSFDGPPFPWNPERRARLRAELDAYYGRLYGLTREELRYLLIPTDVMGEDYPSETFRVLKNNEIREVGEYRTRRLVLEAWDRLEANGWREAPASTSTEVQYSSIGMIQSIEEAKFAGLIAALIQGRPDGITTAELQSVVARSLVASEQLDVTDAQRLALLLAAADWLQPTAMLNRVLTIVQRLEAAGVAVRKRTGPESRFFQGEAALPADVLHLDEHEELARLLLAAESRRLAAQFDSINTQDVGQRSQGM